MADVVLDVSALLAWMLQEPGAGVVDPELDGAFVSAVNFTEVITKLIDLGLAPEEAVRRALKLPCRVAPVDTALAIDAGVLRAQTAHLGLSLGDRACLALGRRLGLPVLTCDRPWASLDLGMEIRLVR
jgi:ribonuclease VapC